MATRLSDRARCPRAGRRGRRERLDRSLRRPPPQPHGSWPRRRPVVLRRGVRRGTARKKPAHIGKVAAPLIVGVVTEIKPDEYRVALTPAGALELRQRGHDVLVEAGAGLGRSVSDTAS